MPADQAAGLRRRASRQPLQCVYACFDSPQTVGELTLALHESGKACLLVDMLGRLFRDTPSRSLFDWRKQLERGHPETMEQPYGAGWYAPGVAGPLPGLLDASRRFDCVVFDAGVAGEWVYMPGTAHTVILEVGTSHDALLRAYRRIKTLLHAGARFHLALLGEREACERVRAACARFLGSALGPDSYCVEREVGAFSALAIRMAGEETGLTTRQITGST